jgi:hypothetical protein
MVIMLDDYIDDSYLIQLLIGKTTQFKDYLMAVIESYGIKVSTRVCNTIFGNKITCKYISGAKTTLTFRSFIEVLYTNPIYPTQDAQILMETLLLENDKLFRECLIYGVWHDDWHLPRALKERYECMRQQVLLF